jgi:Xaa-Pro aminopeptidase
MRRLALLLLIASTSSAAFAGEFQDDLKARRAKLMAQLGPDAIAVLWSAEPKTYSYDVAYEFRQDADLYYLSGVDQENTTLVLMPGNQTEKEILFIRDPDPRREHWRGHSLTIDEAKAQSGIATVYYASAFESFVDAMFARETYGMRRTAESNEFDTFFDAVAKGRARLGLRLEPLTVSSPLDRAQKFGSDIRDRVAGVTVVNISDDIHNLRQVKTPYEQRILERSLEISSEAHAAGMRAAHPGAYEYEVEAAIEQVYLSNGAMTPGYPSIVGSGPNATILHYEKSSRRMEPGDLLLVDAAASYQYLTGDITRTYPVSGTFSPIQRDIYELVFAAQEAAMKAARAGVRTTAIEKASEEVIKPGLLKLGLITDASGDQFRTWYTHGICHFIGLDVHDAGDYKRLLEPGMAFTIEPGLYIRPEALDNLSKTPENLAFIEKVKPALEKYKYIGVRIEDSFLLTETGLKRLSVKAPRTIDEIESLKRSSN